ncbi:glycoside hydrolase family 78 protein [Paenibacillus aceris]|uniref:alpha-L-rhamnosidase n=1 Tax=Paenibacillus aceris TaxID=869555 RepID=A0ABS4I493_9BACL|nr:glycoside hydrolase family 78 protein [Paenibacillus aceris]MBP1965226.1 alpha-L-rhamnosidase [Paenibacillus aceris]NHW33202.1 family 78 glycoside hydrolase catalytic domain [Paenibacillus aceris]
MTLLVAACKTEYLTNPIGLDVLKPRLFWQLRADNRGVEQSAYHIMVASSREKLEDGQADMWDSGKVDSNASTHVQYEGKPLQSQGEYYWKVRIWDGAGEVSAWSETAFWMMGMLSRGEWKAQWIGRKSEPEALLQPSPFLRKSFEIGKKVRRAIAYATALGVYDLHLNGERIGDRFAPGWTDYNTRVQVQAVDITEKLTAGDNAFGVILGDGWYAGTVGFLGDKVYGERPFFLMQVSLDYEDGTKESIMTDRSWTTSRGPIQYSDMIKGEAYDAREELTGWHEPGYDDSSWEAPDVRSGYNGLLVAAVEPPIRITQTLKPISLKKTATGTYIYDMGQNMVGWTAVKVQGERGTMITLSHAEILNPDGTLYVDNLREACQQDHYILKGEGQESYEPHFTFHGFRYVELIGYPGEPDLDTITGKVVHSDTPVTGKLETSDAMVNQLYSNITWGQRGNFLSVPTDCPQRDERLGWTGDAQIFARTAAYNMDVSRFFSKYVWDMVDCQQPSGAFTDVAPDAGWIRHKNWNTRLNWFAPDNSGWGDAGVIIPWTLYLMYGDKRVLETHYEAMVKWVHYLKNTTDELVRPGYANYADWLSIGADTPNEVLATAYFAYSTKLLAQVAGVLGKTEDASQYQALFDDIAEAFRNAFVAEDGRIHGDTQTVYVLALQFGLLTKEQRKQALERLVADIHGRGDRLSTGFLGVGYLLPALTDNGSLDVAYKLLTQEAFPSWMYSIKHGATTIWERWDGWTEEQGFQTPSMNSFNHYSLGSVGEWMFRYMAGIEADPEAPGFQHVIISPKPGGNLSWVKASYESLYGCIKVEWSRSDEGDFRLQVEVPANTTATIHVPGQTSSVHKVGSGSYVFENVSMLN